MTSGYGLLLVILNVIFPGSTSTSAFVVEFVQNPDNAAYLAYDVYGMVATV